MYNPPREGSRALTRQLSIHRTQRGLLLFGAESPHTEDEPFLIQFEEVTTPLDVLDRIAEIAGRGWGATPADLLAIARELLNYLDLVHEVVSACPSQRE